MAGADKCIKRESVIPGDFEQPCDLKVDLSGSCRLCLLQCPPSHMTQIFRPVLADSWEMVIANVTNIKVHYGDGLPALICNSCIFALKHSREFKENSIAGDNLLRNVLFQPTDQLSADNEAQLPRVYKQHEGIAEMSGFCRLCVTYFAPDKMIPIFHDNGLESLPDIITRVAGIKVQQGDGLPASICDCCGEKLRRASEFIANAGAKDLYLRTELFQVQDTAAVPNDPLELDFKPNVKLEPDDAEHVVSTNAIPHGAKETISTKESFAINLRLSTTCHLCHKTFTSKSSVLPHLRKVHKWKQKPLKCDKCTRVFHLQAFLDTHKLMDHQPKVKKSFTCDECKKTFVSKGDCARHVTAVHFGVKAKKRFQCDVCKEMFWSKLSCARHIMTHPELKTDIAPTFQCKLCEKKFWFRTNYVRHVASHAEVKTDIEKTIQCEVCGKKFWHMSSCLGHMRVHSAAKPFKCQVCKKGFKSVKECKKHQVVHSTERPHTCEICKKTFKGIPGLKLHLTRHASKERCFACKICDCQFFSQINLKAHQAVHSDARPHACNQCDKTFKTSGNLRQHQKTHGTTALICTVCGKPLSTEKSYHDHMRQHTGDLPFKCKVCEKPFPTEGNLGKHMETHTEHRAKFHCHICKKTYLYQHSLTKHLITHQDRSKSFICALCPSRYNTKVTLKDHIRRKHAKETPHKCEFCGKGYFVKGELTMHVTTHTGDRPYKCGSCDGTFSRRQILQRHIRRMHMPVNFHQCVKCNKKFRQKESMIKHTCGYIGPRPFACDVCGSDFRTLNNVRKHITLVHSDARPHKCSKCDKCFKTKGNMNIHLKKHKAE